MIKRTIFGATARRSVAGVAVVAVLGLGGSAFAELGSGSDNAGTTDAVTTDSTTFDSTVLTKFIAGRGFVASQGATADANLVDVNGDTCLQPSASSTNTAIDVVVSVELPDGARDQANRVLRRRQRR